MLGYVCTYGAGERGWWNLIFKFHKTYSRKTGNLSTSHGNVKFLEDSLVISRRVKKKETLCKVIQAHVKIQYETNTGSLST